jgi:beta-lactamase regulating signal transducer with metallopeptidase domain
VNLLPLWNNTFLLTMSLVTVVLAIACIAASRVRFSAVTKNSILLPALAFALASPFALVATRSADWSMTVPVLPANPGMSQAVESDSGPRFLPGSSSTAGPAATPTDRVPADERVQQADASIVLHVTKLLTIGLLFIWATGSTLCLVQLGRSYLALWRLLANAHPVNDARVEEAADQARSALGLRKYPTILVTDRVNSPVAVGTPRHGWVIWPPDTLKQTPHDQLVHVLIHEGAHITHRDTALRLVQGLIAALWWWHPLVHVLNRQLSSTREQLCDNAVISSADPVQYGQTLLEIERPTPAHPSPALAVTLFPEHERLEYRIKSLLNPRRSTMHRSKPLVLVSACLAGVAASALAGATQLIPASLETLTSVDAEWTNHDDRTVSKEYTLAFEDKAQPGHLDIDIKRGDILVTAYDGDELLVRLSIPKKTPESDEMSGDGFRSVTGQPLDFEVRQNGNTIELDANSYEQTTHIEVFVPRRIDLTLDSYRAGVISVVGVEGHIRARSQNNDIILTDIAGSADVYGYNGNFVADFHDVTGDLKFETYNGNIDLTLPADHQTTTYIRAESQDVRSQFAITERPAAADVSEHNDGSRSMDFGKYSVGEINGGGARTVIETTTGAVTLRKM